MKERTEETTFTAEIEALASGIAWVLLPTTDGNAVVRADTIMHIVDRPNGAAAVHLHGGHDSITISTKISAAGIYRLLTAEVGEPL